MSEFYKLIPSQETMYIMHKFTLHKNVVQIPVSVTVDRDLDFDLLTKALNIEIERNDSLRLRFKKQDKEIVQYFIPEYKIDKVKVLKFNTLDEQIAYFEKDASKEVKFLKDECYRICFFTDYKGYKGIFLDVSHLAIDAMGMLVFMYDLFAIYKSLKYGTEMPAPLYSYEDYIKAELKQLENKDRYNKGAAFFKEYHSRGGEPFYAAVHGPAYLEKVRAKKKDPDMRVPFAYSPLYDKVDVLDREISPENSKIILNFCKEHSVAPETLMLLGLRTYLSKINYKNPDVFFTVLCDKRIKQKDLHTGGCMAQPIQVRTIIGEDKTFSEAIDEIFKVRTSLYKHLRFPYTHALQIMRNLYNFSPIQAPGALTFSWLPFPIDTDAGYKMEYRTYNLGRYFSPMYSMYYPNPKTLGIVGHYMYRVKLITPEQVDDMHRNTVKIILKGIENPDITIGELFDIIDV